MCSSCARTDATDPHGYCVFVPAGHSILVFPTPEHELEGGRD